jgi:uncharacterized protein (DUF1697 family)
MRYVALLRGINIGGATMVKMEELRKCFEALGFENVVTYINSGNVGFDCRSPRVSKGATPDAILCSKIEKAVEEKFGRFFSVMVREKSEIERILENNPFDGEYESHKEMHVLFLKEKLSKEKADAIKEAAFEGERYHVDGREIYCHLPRGVAQSLLTKGIIDKRMKINFTGRNWRTVQKLAEL